MYGGFEKKYSEESVRLRITQEFLKLKKLVILQFEQGKPINEIVKEQEKYYGLDRIPKIIGNKGGTAEISAFYKQGKKLDEIAKLHDN